MQQLITSFYNALNTCDSAEMMLSYHDNIVFSDPAFGLLEGIHAKNMWRMLCESQKGKDFRVDLLESKIDGDKGMAKWEAHYNFSKTGRKVHNIIHSEFVFQDEKIIKHSDYFNLHNWARQALGWKGLLLGNTAFFRKQIQKQTNSMLRRYESNLNIEK